MENDTYTCGKCRVRHTIGYPPRASAERLRCPDCSLAFWCMRRGMEPTKVGVLPREVERINMEARAKEEDRDKRLRALTKSAFTWNALEE